MFGKTAQGYIWVTDEPEIANWIEVWFWLIVCRFSLKQFPPRFRPFQAPRKTDLDESEIQIEQFAASCAGCGAGFLRGLFVFVGSTIQFS
jgi:hypothetical protein